MKTGSRAQSNRPAREPSIEKLLEGQLARRYRLRLYVAGNNLNSFHAIENAERICRECLQGRAELEIVDLYQQPALAREDRIIAAPCLVKIYPGPPRRFIGDLSNWQRVLKGLSLRLPNPVIQNHGLEIQR
jgi:circadian clock protein KaiB